ncbi:histidine kinase [Dactylosporangium fulvum]|uniref:histidine kinase n=1 Tax=Dactylosporangium fulvum TaxID=53359 RepID=A0ABY5VVG9_9ACTN|nr:sensor histidine kinase [Dactylosporangium fulvum]UWP81595.1 sensor histidine kinase [Dactylosporangium fulvum]
MSVARLRRLVVDLPPWAVDVFLAVFAGVATVYRIGYGVLQAGDRAPDAVGYGIGVAMSVILLVRRRWPALTLSVVAVLWVCYHTLDYPGGAPAVPVWVALYSVAVASRRRAGLAVAGGLLVSDALARTAQTGAQLFDAALDSSTLLFLAALLLGDGVRSRRAWRAEHEARTALLAAERERATAQVLTEERLRIARELHDVSAHTLAVISVQASVAAELIDDDPRRAGEALEVVRSACREAMGELRAAVGVLRATDVIDVHGDGALDVSALAHGLERLQDLATAHGLREPSISISYVGDRCPLPRLVEITAYRIVQESVTNVLRHADATQVDITVEFRWDGLGLEIRDDGRGALAWRGNASSGGNGLVGMAERAASLGGSLDAGPVGDAGGFRVRAWLPVVV